MLSPAPGPPWGPVLGGWREGEGTISSSLCLRVPHLLEPTRVRICALTAGGGPGQGARVAAAPRGSLKLFLHPVPQPIAEQDCVRHICLQGELIRVNQSQHCPQGTAPPRCGVLGLAVRVGGDHCCPIWECACESWGLPAPPVLWLTDSAWTPAWLGSYSVSVRN